MHTGEDTHTHTNPKNLKQNPKLKTLPKKNLSEFFFPYWLENLGSPLLAALVTITIKAVQKSKLLFSDADAGEDHRILNQMFPGTSLLDQYLKTYKPQGFRCQTQLNPNLRSFTFIESCWLRKS